MCWEYLSGFLSMCFSSKIVLSFKNQSHSGDCMMYICTWCIRPNVKFLTTWTVPETKQITRQSSMSTKLNIPKDGVDSYSWMTGVYCTTCYSAYCPRQNVRKTCKATENTLTVRLTLLYASYSVRDKTHKSIVEEMKKGVFFFKTAEWRISLRLLNLKEFCEIGRASCRERV